MKLFFAIFSLALCTVGISFYLSSSASPTSKMEYTSIENNKDNVKNPNVPRKNNVITAKECTCCQSTLATIKRKRKELELWARDMINTYGYEDGMRRITEKSPTLAKRIEKRLETEKISKGIPVP